jgi:hypothetical protein
MNTTSAIEWFVVVNFVLFYYVLLGKQNNTAIKHIQFKNSYKTMSKHIAHETVTKGLLQ